MYTLYLFTHNMQLKEKYIELSRKAKNSSDAGVDLYVPRAVKTGGSSGTLFLDHQIVCRMTRMTEEKEEKDVSYYLYPRSSISKTPFRLANSVGIIDAGYRGYIIAALDYKDEYELEEGSRLVQICAPTLDPVRLVVCDSLEDMNMNTERSTGGFGSTGK